MNSLYSIKKSKSRAILVSLFFIAMVAVAVYYVAEELSNRQSEDRIRDAMLEVRAFHHYIQNDMLPNYYRLMNEGRLPHGFYAPELLSSSYMARTFQKYYNNEREAIGLPLVQYKLAAEDPRNPLNKATESEIDLIKWFNDDPKRDHLRMIQEEDGRKFLVVAVPFLKNERKCLVCHGKVSDAPEQLQQLYQWTGGFDRRVGEISAVEIMKTPIKSQFGMPFYASISALLVSSILAAVVIGGYLCRIQVRVATGKLEKQQEQLLVAKEKAESASVAKSEFLANMSHEIRTPINGVLGMLQLLKEAEPNNEQMEYIRIAIKSTNRLTRLLSDILDISRIESGKMQLLEADVDIRKIKESIEEVFAETAREKGVDLTFSWTQNFPETLRGDEVRLHQILFNLVGNAIKFTDKGSVCVSASVLPFSAQADIRVLITVADTGIGISDENLKNIFEPFVQVEGSYTRRFQGAGLGLSIVRKIVVLMGGTLAIESELGKGTTVYLSLPFTCGREKAGRAISEEETNSSGIGKQLQILFAEDDPVSSIAGKRLLEKAGYCVTTAKDGQEVLDHLAGHDVDLILMDIQMPVLDGVETAKAIRQASHLGAKSRIPIIAVTAYAMTGDREKILASGMSDYIAKPVDKARLVEVIERVMKTEVKETRKG
ncbi:ATP-binding protein [Desulfolutivibrio sp.]|uniref:ATP-binding protein n=1 Tax=Desulfolutivibrio sp. TaxID=2773296 RepID=UPI002F963BD1